MVAIRSKSLLSRYERLALSIQAKVQAYWNQHRLPIGGRWVINPAIARLPESQRQQFKQFLTEQGYVHIELERATASTFVFPPLAANSIDEAEILRCMQDIHRQRLRARSAARRARHELT